MLKVNINDQVKFKLTKAGADYLNDYNSKIHQSLKSDYKEDDEFICQLWDFCNTFGPLLYMGNTEVPIQTCELEIIKTT